MSKDGLGGIYVEAIRLPDIEAWSRLYGITLRTWEVELIAVMDVEQRRLLGNMLAEGKTPDVVHEDTPATPQLLKAKLGLI